MSYQTVFVIRHGEKPEKEGGPGGVDEFGLADPESLTPKGWQRAGAWTQFFCSSFSPAVLTPLCKIYASNPVSAVDQQARKGGSKSKRPSQTVSSIATKLRSAVNLSFVKGDEDKLGAALCASEGIVLVCWQHESIASITVSMTPASGQVPGIWPDDRFNVVLKYDRPENGDEWLVTQFAPVMFAGDLAIPI